VVWHAGCRFPARQGRDLEANQITSRRQFEERAAVVISTLICHPVEVARFVFDHTGYRRFSVATLPFGAEIVKTPDRTVVFEHVSVLPGPTVNRCTKQIAIGVHDQTAVRDVAVDAVEIREVAV
jgi:hypothetical protein